MYIRGEMLLVMGLTLLLSPFALKGVEVQIHKNDTGAAVAIEAAGGASTAPPIARARGGALERDMRLSCGAAER